MTGYTTTLNAERLPSYVLVIGRATYTLPQCVCQVHAGACVAGAGQPHPAFKAGKHAKYWTLTNVQALAEFVSAGKLPHGGSTALPTRAVRAAKAPKTDPTPEQVADLQDHIDTVTGVKTARMWSAFAERAHAELDEIRSELAQAA